MPAYPASFPAMSVHRCSATRARRLARVVTTAPAAAFVGLLASQAAVAQGVSAPAGSSGPPGLTVTVEADAGRAVLAAVLDSGLTIDQARRVAQLPGNQGLLRKARAYGRPADEDTFARALAAAAHGAPMRGDTGASDVSDLRFGPLRAHALRDAAVLAALTDPAARRLDAVQARIALFAPPGVTGRVTGHLIVGGRAGGFAFGDPEFFLNVERFPSALLASTVMQHELYHAVQALARQAHPPGPAVAACLAGVPHADVMGWLFDALQAEGTASLVGDMLALPLGVDSAADAERARVARNVAMVARSVTQLELSVHGLATRADVRYDDVYALGFYGDEVLYALGYVMARAIAREQGEGAIGALVGRPGAAFVARYVGLSGYGRSDAAPSLRAETIRAATQLAACE